VPVEGLEPPRPKALVPKTCVQTNFITPTSNKNCTQNIPLYEDGFLEKSILGGSESSLI
tara:strand:+ start:233 stop:409 length:177 start_codon:yes stop_codon:yes gene_type:complete